MSGFTVKREIAAPIAEVFSRATDFAAAGDTIEGIERVELLTGGPVGLGTRFRETRIMFGREATEEMEVTAFEPPRRYSLGCENHGCRYHSDFQLAEPGEGTEITMSFEATPLTFVAKVMSILTKPLQKKMFEICAKDLDDLKASIESRRR